MNRLPKILATQCKCPSDERILDNKPYVATPELKPSRYRWFFAIGAVLAENGTRQDISYGEIGVGTGLSMLAFCKGFALSDQRRAPYVKLEGWDSEADKQSSNAIAIETMLVAGFPAPQLHICDTESRMLGSNTPFDVFHVDGGKASFQRMGDMESGWELLKPNGIMLVNGMWDKETSGSVLKFAEGRGISVAVLPSLFGLAYMVKQWNA